VSKFAWLLDQVRVPRRSATGVLLLALAAASVRADDIPPDFASVIYQGDGVFLVTPPAGVDGDEGSSQAVRIDLTNIRYSYDPRIDPDVPVPTNVTLDDVVAPMVDPSGREYALITLYQIDPPLADLPSVEAGVDRGIDMRSPADMVKSAYSNYVSPVFTNDEERLPVPNHPIGHFFVKVEIGGYPTVLTGMTTIQRADDELVDLTLERQLGIGGVLLTPQPGRLNTAAEAFAELQLRQRPLRVMDGLYYNNEGGRNVGPEYLIDDGNVVFARFKVPVENAKDAMAVFVQFVAQGQHHVFGSLINRPYKGTGAGCTPFAMSWLKASGVVPFVSESGQEALSVDDMTPAPVGVTDFWQNLLRDVPIPWSHVGCDERVGASGAVAADYTVYDLLFFNERASHLIEAVPGLAEKIKRDQGAVVATLFSFGALTPLRDLVISAKRKDPDDLGVYTWAEAGAGFQARFWDNGRFSGWIKQFWETGETPPGIALVREGRFLGIEVDAMQVPRQSEPFFDEAERIQASLLALSAQGRTLSTCQGVFGLELQ